MNSAEDIIYVQKKSLTSTQTKLRPFQGLLCLARDESKITFETQNEI